VEFVSFALNSLAVNVNIKVLAEKDRRLLGSSSDGKFSQGICVETFWFFSV